MRSEDCQRVQHDPKQKATRSKGSCGELNSCDCILDSERARSSDMITLVDLVGSFLQEWNDFRTSFY